MFINFKNFHVKEELFSGKSVHRYSVESKDKGHIGEIYFIRDANGVSSIEWCKGNITKGFGAKIDLEELFELLESRGETNEE
jgi:hypothetical protein